MHPKPLIHDAPPNPSTTGDDNRPAHPPHAPVCCQSSIDMMPERATEMFQSRSSITSADRVSITDEMVTAASVAFHAPGNLSARRRMRDALSAALARVPAVQADTDLLSALDNLAVAFLSHTGWTGEPPAEIVAARAAIAKATGSANQVTE